MTKKKKEDHVWVGWYSMIIDKTPYHNRYEVVSTPHDDDLTNSIQLCTETTKVNITKKKKTLLLPLKKIIFPKRIVQYNYI